MCWNHCFYDAVIERMPAAVTRRVLATAQTDATCTLRYEILHGPTEWLMGGAHFWRFGPTPADELASPRAQAPWREWGAQRLMSNLKAWLTAVSNTSVYQGWHDWHADGPSHYGRYHKIFVMVDKAGAPATAQQTNVRLIPADTLYAHAPCFERFANEEGSITREFSRDGSESRLGLFRDAWPRANDSQAVRNAKAHRIRMWGMNNLWHGFERLGCKIPMNPGDVLFFREDIWHRTQDMTNDRIGLILDILRFPNCNDRSHPAICRAACAACRRAAVSVRALGRRVPRLLMPPLRVSRRPERRPPPSTSEAREPSGGALPLPLTPPSRAPAWLRGQTTSPREPATRASTRTLRSGACDSPM